MPATDFIPTRDSTLVAWSANFSTRITATPTAFGLVAGDATAYAALNTAYSSAYTAAVTPSTRTAVTIAAKDTARISLVAKARELAAKVQATPSVTPSQKEDLGITPRDAVRTPIPPPTTRPVVTINSSAAGVYDLRIVDELTPTRAAKPADAIACQLFYKTGATPPAQVSDCIFGAAATRSIFGLDLSSVAIGTTVHIMARWQNRRGQVGPDSLVATQVRAA